MRAWMFETVLLKRGEAPWDVYLPVDAGSIERGEWYWLARYVPDSYGEDVTLKRLPWPPFDSREKANAFLEKNWPAWLGDCDVVLDSETLYECDEDGKHLYGRDVYVCEVYDALARGVNIWHRQQFDEYVDNFYRVLTQRPISIIRNEHARQLCDELKAFKLKWIAEEPERVEKAKAEAARRDAESEKRGIGASLSGLRDWYAPAVTEAELVLASRMRNGLALMLDAGILYGNGNCCSMEGLLTRAVSEENTWVDASGNAVLPKTLGDTSVADVDRS